MKYLNCWRVFENKIANFTQRLNNKNLKSVKQTQKQDYGNKNVASYSIKSSNF